MTCLDCKGSPAKLCDAHRVSSSNLDDEWDVEIERLTAELNRRFTVDQVRKAYWVAVANPVGPERSHSDFLTDLLGALESRS